MPTENQQIGPYTLISKLGQGGFGEVWLGEKKTKFLTKKLAIKLPRSEEVDTEAVKLEATLWEQASGHSNVLPIIDADEYDGQIVIVSEYAPDGSLADLLRSNKSISVDRAVALIDGILAGLEFLHSRKIIHRDLKPENVLLQGETPRLADFGISRVLRNTVTSSSVNLAGTPFYMAPEAFQKKRNVKTDIWAVGVIFYEILAGKRPFEEDSLIDLATVVAAKDPDALPDTIHPSLKRVVSHALAKRPEDRYASAYEMRLDIGRVSSWDEIETVAQAGTGSDEQETLQADNVSKSKQNANRFRFIVSYVLLFSIINFASTIADMLLYFSLRSHSDELLNRFLIVPTILISLVGQNALLNRHLPMVRGRFLKLILIFIFLLVGSQFLYIVPINGFNNALKVLIPLVVGISQLVFFYTSVKRAWIWIPVQLILGPSILTIIGIIYVWLVNTVLSIGNSLDSLDPLYGTMFALSSFSLLLGFAFGFCQASCVLYFKLRDSLMWLPPH